MATKPKDTPIVKKKSKAGRPRKIDDKLAKLISGMAAIGHTAEEIGPFLGVNPKAITTTYREYYMEGFNRMKNSLRHAQFKKAVIEGHATMLIWMGKQFLDQTDNGPLNPDSDVGDVELVITVLKREKIIKKMKADQQAFETIEE